MDSKTFLKSLSLIPLTTMMSNLNDLEKLSNQFPNTERMPVLFLGHGNPMYAIEENEFVDGFRNIAKSLPKPNAILCISAHWFTNGTKVTAMEMPKTIHDFGGFPDELFKVQYPAHGSPVLAKETKELLKPIAVELDEKWGLDHGAWSVIKHLYPKADIPVIQLSIDSGNIIHNLGLVDFKNLNKINYGFDWAIEAREKINNWINKGDIHSIIDYEKQGSAIQLAVPTPEHYLPLIYSLALKQKSESIKLFNDKLLAGSLSMTSLIIE